MTFLEFLPVITGLFFLILGVFERGQRIGYQDGFEVGRRLGWLQREAGTPWEPEE